MDSKGTLLERFGAYLEEEALWRPGQTWLVAVSGGLDSVVLTHLCLKAGIAVRIAHCNFQLRGNESERDELFVRKLALAYGSPLSVERFDTTAYATRKGLSIQVAARELRYGWFRTFLPVVNAIATAHHQDDNIETLLMNFFKGTGASGLRAMLPFQHDVVRPLLFASRKELEDYAVAQHLEHVEDSSNDTDKYNRNFIRHKVLPLLEERYPVVRSSLAGNLSRFRDMEVLYQEAVTRHRKEIMEWQPDGSWRLSVLKLQRAVPQETLIYELMKHFGFTPSQAVAIRQLLNSTPGHFVSSSTHRLLKDRKVLLLSALSRSADDAPLTWAVLEEGSPSVLFAQGQLEASTIAADLTGATDNPRIALLNADVVEYPLVLRKWKAGDYFYPLGMRKKKKLSRFFIDRKLSLAEKEKIWVLESGGRIHWVLGLRIDDRSKITPGTTRMVRLEWKS
jgi:tRNA(Ile)-lysidine synthase